MTTPAQPDPAAQLRAAAQLLRERASAATPGPWDSNGDTEIYTTTEADTTTLWIGGTERFGGSGTGEANAAWIALMHPGVGESLADWLDTAADAYDNGDCSRCHCHHCRDTDCACIAPALAVARAILGGSDD